MSMTIMRGEIGAGARALLVVPPALDLAALLGILTDLDCRYRRAAPGADLAGELTAYAPHLLVAAAQGLLDLLDLCRLLRGLTPMPLVVVGQRPGEEDEVLCLEYGADEYLEPGISPQRMRARLLALLRRSAGRVPVEDDPAISFGDVRIDARRHRVYRGERELDLSQKEYALLIYLAENAGRAVSRQALADVVWGSGATGESRSLDVHIHWLREKLEADAGNPRHIRTVRGVGYCFEP